MAQPQPAKPVKLLVALLWSEAPFLEEALKMLREQWGEVDYNGFDREFDATNYYEAEMGPNLKRRLIAFARLVPPESVREAKLICNGIEERLADGVHRRVNLDVGYLDHNKIVLASVKYAGQKIHLGDGIYADLIARYCDGCYRPFEWTFPDFRDGRYDEELARIRVAYLRQLREKN